jgi:Domain of unknown function (DUF4188)
MTVRPFAGAAETGWRPPVVSIRQTRIGLWREPTLLVDADREVTSLRRGAAVEVRRGRYTADIDGDFVVFLIGMRINHPLRFRKWWPVAAAMPKMLKVLSQHPELGCLGFQQWFGRTTLLVQYWRDFDSLDRFARDKDLSHLEPWRRFNRAVRASGHVGIWHETFRVRAGEYEAVYGNMPIFGLAAAATHLPAARKGNTAAARIGASTTDEPAVAPY